MNNFEFNAKADEWLDVTSCEEILRNELNQTRNILETKQMELLELNVTIDLLKGHKTLLENERASLLAEVEETRDALYKTSKNLEATSSTKQSAEKELRELKSSAKSKIEMMELSMNAAELNLKTCYTQIRKLEQEVLDIKGAQARAQAEANRKLSQLNALNQKQHQEVVESMAIRKNQVEQIAQLQRALADSRAREEGLRGDVQKQSEMIEQRDVELKDTKNRLGSVSALAQALKERNSSLVLSVVAVQQQLNENTEKCSAGIRREADLQKQVEQLNSYSEEYAKKQEKAIRQSFVKLEQAEDRIAGLESYAEDLKEQFVALSLEQDVTRARLAEKEAENMELIEEKTMLEERLVEKSKAFEEDLERAYKSMGGREESLRAELEKQKVIFDARLTEIRTILGMTAIGEIKKEISNVGKIYTEHQQRIRSCPSVKSPTLRVPLMIGMMHQQPQQQHQKAN